MDSLIKFHIDNKYCVVVNKIENGCAAHFPANYFIDNPVDRMTFTYKISDDGISYSTDDFHTGSIAVPKYAIRLSILTDIIIKATSLDIPNKLIVINNNGVIESSLIKILPKCTEENDSQKEALLSQVYSDILIGLFDATSADKLGISRGYETLCDIIDRGGLT